MDPPSKVMNLKNLKKNKNIQHITIAPYHPSSNGAAERFVETFKSSMLKLKLEVLSNLMYVVYCENQLIKAHEDQLRKQLRNSQNEQEHNSLTQNNTQENNPEQFEELIEKRIIKEPDRLNYSKLGDEGVRS